MKKMKWLLLAALLCLAAPVTTKAQSVWPDGRIDAYTKPNPAFPVQLTAASCTVIDDYVLIACVVQGHGTFQCFEMFDNGPSQLVYSGRATEQPTVQIFFVPLAHFNGCFFNLFNVHGWGGAQL